MKIKTPFLDGLHLKTLGKKRLGSTQRMVNELARLKQKNLSQLSECFRSFIPNSKLRPSNQKAHSRRRIFSKQNTFWAFFSQVIDSDGGCKEVVRKVQSYASIKALKLPASSSSAYCQARSKLAQLTSWISLNTLMINLIVCLSAASY